MNIVSILVKQPTVVILCCLFQFRHSALHYFMLHYLKNILYPFVTSSVNKNIFSTGKLGKNAYSNIATLYGPYQLLHLVWEIERSSILENNTLSVNGFSIEIWLCIQFGL